MRKTRDRRAVIRRFVELGATVTAVRRTGELEVRHPALGARRVKWNRRRLDMPVQVIAALEKIERATAESQPPAAQRSGGCI